ncbi:MAG: hypothetical protein AB7H90_04680 [Alphaproteobacteria bacterium]
MPRLGLGRCAAIVVAVLATGAVALGAASSSRASVISDTPTLPLLDVPYVTSLGGTCFPLAGVCVTGGEFVLTAPVSSSFDAAGQHITTGALFFGTLTTLSDVPIGPLQLAGTVEQEIIGRTFATQTGSWTTNLVSLLLSGPVLGLTGTMTLDPAHASTGIASITPIGPATLSKFEIDSFFDVFLQLSLNGLSTTRGPIRAEAVQAVPEPSSLAVIAIAVPMMLAIYRRRGTAPPKDRPL